MGCYNSIKDKMKEKGWWVGGEEDTTEKNEDKWKGEEKNNKVTQMVTFG